MKFYSKLLNTFKFRQPILFVILVKNLIYCNQSTAPWGRDTKHKKTQDKLKSRSTIDSYIDINILHMEICDFKTEDSRIIYS